MSGTPSRSRLLLLALTATLAGCAGAPAASGSDPATDERAIYRLLLEDQETGRYGGAMLVLEDSLTTLRRDQITGALQRNTDIGLTPSDLAAIDGLLAAGRTPPRVPLDLVTRRPYEVGDSTSAAEARDVLFVSGIGFGPARDHAVVHVDYFCEGCGWGGLTFFSRGPDGWRIEGRRWMWRS